jgi:hypothetical protein
MKLQRGLGAIAILLSNMLMEFPPHTGEIFSTKASGDYIYIYIYIYLVCDSKILVFSLIACLFLLFRSVFEKNLKKIKFDT